LKGPANLIDELTVWITKKQLKQKLEF